METGTGTILSLMKVTISDFYLLYLVFRAAFGDNIGLEVLTLLLDVTVEFT